MRFLAILFTCLLSAALPAAAQVGDWTGPYIGVAAGTTQSDFARDPCCPGPVGRSGKAMVSIHAGHDWQNGNMVYGVRADLAFQDVRAEAPFGFGPWDQKLMAVARARAGVVHNNVLFFATLGYGVQRVEVPGDSDFAGGIAGGVGFESRALAGRFGLDPSWSVEGEAFYIRAEETTLTQGGTSVIGSSDNVVIKLGINRRF